MAAQNEKLRVVVVGGVAGGASAAARVKRVCFGMRNFRNIRNRILFCSGVPKKPRRG